MQRSDASLIRLRCIFSAVVLLKLHVAKAFRNGSTLVPLADLPLRTSGRYVVSAASGRRVRLFCVNWYGSHLEQMVPNGLNKQPLEKYVARIAELGFNCVRLPYSVEMAVENISEVYQPWDLLAANPNLQSHSPLEVFDATVAALTEQGLLVILNNHISTSKWCCDEKDDEAIWYTDKYPESDWLHSLGMMAARYRSNPRVCGFDLRNEVRPSLTVTPTWGGGDPASDWAMAAVKGGRRVLAENSDMLVVVSGMNFCMYLCDVPSLPIHITVPEFRGKLVYTVHEYPWFQHHLVAAEMIEMYFRTVVLVCAAVCFLLVLRLVWVQAACYKRIRLVIRSKPEGKDCEAPAKEENAHATAVHQTDPADVLSDVRGRCPCEFIGVVSSGCLSVALILVGDHVVVTGCNTQSWHFAIVAFFFALMAGLACLLFTLRLVLLGAKAFDARQRRDEVMSVVPQGSGCAPQCPNRIPGLSSRCVSPVLKWLVSCNCISLALAFSYAFVLQFVYSELGSYRKFEYELDRRWGFVLEGSEDLEPAPVWVGEFGTAVDNMWWQYLMRYMKERDVDWAYWSFNGQKRIDNTDETYGLLMNDAVTVRHWWKLHALHDLMN